MSLEDDSLFENLNNGIGSNSAKSEVGSRIHVKREGAGSESLQA